MSQKIKINDYKELFHGAKLRLGQLMGLPVGAEFVIITYIDTDLQNAVNIDELEQIALNRRPELFQEDLQESITHDEAKATILQMLPSPQLFINPQADDNKFLYYDTWLTAGLNVSWNLLDIPNKIFSAKANYKRMDFIRKKRMALAVAIITQLRIAGIEYDYAINRYNSLHDLAEDSKEMIVTAEKAMKAGKAKKSAIITKKIGALSDYAASMEAYSRVMVAKARIYNTAGLDKTEEESGIVFAAASFSENDSSNNNTVYLTEKNEPVVETETTVYTVESTPVISAIADSTSPVTDEYILEQYK